MTPILSMHVWVSVPTDVRYKIRSIFQIPCSGHTHVHDGVIQTDGTTPKDFESLTIEKMQKYLDTDSTDFYKLFDSVIAKIVDAAKPKPPLEATGNLTINNIAPKKRGKK